MPRIMQGTNGARHIDSANAPNRDQAIAAQGRCHCGITAEPCTAAPKR
jgi:hypothetical protein